MCCDVRLVADFKEPRSSCDCIPSPFCWLESSKGRQTGGTAFGFEGGGGKGWAGVNLQG